MSYEFHEVDAGGVDYMQSTEPEAEDDAVWVDPSDGAYEVYVSDGSNWYSV